MTLDRDKLAKILSLLGSDKLGEAMSAARAADALIRNAKTSWAEVLNENGVADSARGVHTDNEARALAAEYEVRRARAENEKLRETVMQLAVEINDLREQAARRLAHRILDGVKQAGQALRALAIAFDGIALVHRQLAARLRDSERRTRRVVVHGLAAAGIALAIGIVAFLSLQHVAKLGGPSVQSGTMASSRQEAPEATARSSGLPSGGREISTPCSREVTSSVAEKSPSAVAEKSATMAPGPAPAARPTLLAVVAIDNPPKPPEPQLPIQPQSPPNSPPVSPPVASASPQSAKSGDLQQANQTPPTS